MNAPISDALLSKNMKADATQQAADALPLLPTEVLSAVIVGSGFGGIGMAIELRKKFIRDFIILEKGGDAGGVWRDNTYPGAACDVPSHLYSFSFELNPNWTHTFAPQAEIHAYLKNCVEKYKLQEHFKFGCEVASARFDEQDSIWHITLVNGQTVRSRLFITAMGQLSRPSIPKIKGIETFKGKSFHSAKWAHDVSLKGKRVAVVGTGASAIQFVPAIAPDVQHLKLFQRSASYILPRQNRRYSEFTKSIHSSLPVINRLHRLGIYLTYESRALAFTRFKGLMKVAAAGPFEKMLKQQVKDPVLREKLIPNYPVGCKRLLLSSEYLRTMTRPNVELITDSIDCVYENGIQTKDGVKHEVDTIIYGTGFAATDFLAPLNITGLNGQTLKQAWKQGAKAHLGITVPGFPNMFMLYGPNTNLGHNSIVYMLESQIRYVMRAFEEMRLQHAQRIELHEDTYQSYNDNIQSALGHTVWNGCKSWYVDDKGHNSVSWPGFTLTYRWLTSTSSLKEFKFTKTKHAEVSPGVPVRVRASHSKLDNALGQFFAGFLTVAFKTPVGNPTPPKVQRLIVRALGPLMPGRGGVTHYTSKLGRLDSDVCVPQTGEKRGAILYLHGGAFVLGSHKSHVSVTSYLAHQSGRTVYTPAYRLAPEHPCPAAIDDCVVAYKALLAQGYAGSEIVVSGDSAGGFLSLALALRLKQEGLPMPAALALISPVTDLNLQGSTIGSLASEDPMVRLGWLKQGVAAFAPNLADEILRPLDADLSGLPPVYIQVGEREILLSDSTRLATRLKVHGVPCQLDVFEKCWHVFHLQSLYLSSARRALVDLADFMAKNLDEALKA
jgi:cation diffusion facilitator CzcD-associated flavoprotein CzcO/acetyl esterase/lipase